FGPHWSNSALYVHDVLTWVGLPYIIYHSITRLKWLKEPHRRTIKTGNVKTEAIHPVAGQPQSVMSRRAFIRLTVGTGIAIAVGPSFVKWLSSSLSPGESIEKIVESDANNMVPLPQPLPASSPPIGGGSKGTFRIYTVTEIPKFDNTNFSFIIDGLVD